MRRFYCTEIAPTSRIVAATTSAAAPSSFLLVAVPGSETAARGWLKPGLLEPPLDKQIGDTTRRGPPVAHALPHYKKAHKLLNSTRWKSSNLVAQPQSGDPKSLRLRETHGEGRVDESGQYRDWLHGEERRFANYMATALFLMSASLFYYTVQSLAGETFDVPSTLLVKPPEVASNERKEASKLIASAPTSKQQQQQQQQQQLLPLPASASSAKPQN